VCARVCAYVIFIHLYKTIKKKKRKKNNMTKTDRKEDPRLSTPGFGRGSFLADVQRKKPWCSTHFFQKFLHSSLPSKWNSTTSL